eukprot:9137863-Alexandrium_andersonii.AAC.1
MTWRWTPLALRSASTQPAKSASAHRCGSIAPKESPTQPTIQSPAEAPCDRLVLRAGDRAWTPTS